MDFHSIILSWRFDRMLLQNKKSSLIIDNRTRHIYGFNWMWNVSCTLCYVSLHLNFHCIIFTAIDTESWMIPCVHKQQHTSNSSLCNNFTFDSLHSRSSLVLLLYGFHLFIFYVERKTIRRNFAYHSIRYALVRILLSGCSSIHRICRAS